MPRSLRLAVPLLLAFFLYFFKLDGVGLLGPDEPRYAWIGREMAQSNDYITPTLYGSPWFEKPVLLYWMTALGFEAGLSDDLAPRLPVAVLGFLFLAAYWRLLRESLDEETASKAVAILGTTSGWLAFSHVAVTDLPLTVCFSLGMLLSIEWITKGERRRLPYAGAAFGLALLAKGLVAGVLSLPLLWMTRRRWRDWWRVAVPALLVAAPWYSAAAQRHGTLLWEEFFVKHHFGRVTTDELQHVQPFWFYVPVLLGLMAPWTPLLATIFRRPAGTVERFLLLWFLWGFLFFAIPKNKLASYILPAIPALAAVLASRTGPDTPRGLLIAGGVLIALVPAAGSVLPVAVDHGLFKSLEDFRPWGLLWTIPAAAVLWRGRQYPVQTLAAMVVLAVVYLKIAVFPALDREASARPVWREKQAQASEVCLENPRRSFQYGINYYAHAEVPPCETHPREIRISSPE